MCVCVERVKWGVCVGNNQRFPYRGFRLSHHVERGKQVERGQKTRQVQSCFYILQSSVWQRERGNVRGRGKMREKLKEDDEEECSNRGRPETDGIRQPSTE